MSESITIQFVNANMKSAVLKSYWGGTDEGDERDEGGQGRPAIVRIAQGYLMDLNVKIKERKDGRSFGPLDSLNPDYAMVSFIRWLGADKSFGNNNNPWDFNDDISLLSEPGYDGAVWGHWEFDLISGEAKKVRKPGRKT